MKIVLISLVAVFIAAWAAAMFSSKRDLRMAGRMVMFLYVLAVFGIAAFFFIAPFFAPSGSGAGVMMLPGIVVLVVGFFILSIWLAAKDYGEVAGKPDAEKLKWLEEKTDKITDDLQQQLESDLVEVEKFWISPSRRRKLRQRISENRFFITGLKVAAEKYKDHVEEKAGSE